MQRFDEFNNSKHIAISVGLEGVICLVHLYLHEEIINKIKNANYVTIVTLCFNEIHKIYYLVFGVTLYLIIYQSIYITHTKTKSTKF